MAGRLILGAQQDCTFTLSAASSGYYKSNKFVQDTRNQATNDDDTIFGGKGDDSIDAGGGNDIVSGGAGADTIHGGTGNDFLGGGWDDDWGWNWGRGFDHGNDDGKGKDFLYGDEGNDTIFGGKGADSLFGGADNDRIYGGQGNDLLDGGTGNDLLDGGAGNDTLYGGSGADTIDGGDGKDIYDYNAVSDSAATSGAWDATKGDTLVDFKSGKDKIDFSAIGANLHWATGAGAYGVWAGDVGNNHFLYADTNGDGVADLAIKTNIKLTSKDISGLGNGTPEPVPTPTNTAPVAADDNGAATEAGTTAGANATGNVITGSDTDANGDTLTVTGLRTGTEGGSGTAGTVGSALNGAHGTLTLGADGAYTYAVNNADPDVNALANGQHLTDSFTYTVSDGHGGTDTATITVTINGANDAVLLTSNGGGDTASISLGENTTAVTTVTSADPDNGAVANYSLSGADASLFSIDSAGHLTFTGAPDAEAPADADHDGVYDVTVEVSDGQGSTDSQTLHVTVTDANEFSVSAVADSNADVNTVNENAAAGTVVGIAASATDADATNHSVTYSLTDNAGGRFAIDADTGVITTTGAAIDRETDASFNVTVKATSSDGSTSSGSFTINVNDVNEYNVTPVGDSNAADNSVNENAAAGTAVGIAITASDADAATNHVTYSLTDDAGGRFAIDADTGVITTTGAAIDRETDANFTVTVKATSQDGSESSGNFTINVNDVNESDISAVSDSDAADNGVNENALAGTVVGVTALASDADATNSHVTYSLTDNAGGRFAIDGDTGVITTTGVGIDRETDASFTVTVKATSEDGSESSGNFTINVHDVNESAVSDPADGNAASNLVNENAAAGTAVGITASASDADATNSHVTYSLTNDGGGLFTIDATTGVVTTTGASIDYETLGSSVNITVRASSEDGSSADTNFTVGINDVNDVAATFTSGATGNVAENTTADYVVYNATVSDSDGGVATYSLSGADAGLFSIDAASGEVRFLASTDYESPLDADHDNVYNITVHANDGIHDSTQEVAISVSDGNDVASAFTSGTTGSAVENTDAGNVVYHAAVDDPDGSTAVFSLSGDDAGLFSIDAATGEVRFTAAPDFENPQDAGGDNIYNITVHANDGIHDSTQDVAITVTNVNDVAATFTSGTTASVAENTVESTVVYDAATTDPDGADPLFSLSGDDAALFTINTVTGEVRFTAAPDFENPLDAGHDNVYNITVHANDGVHDSTQNVAVTVSDVNDFAPTFTSGDMANPAENAVASTVVYDANVTDPDGGAISFSLTGTDASRFSINATTGEVRFLNSPNYEAPTDAGGNNVYDIIVHANDGVNESTHAVAVTVANVNEAPVITSGVGGIEDEGTAVSNVVYDANATDPDGNVITYSLTGTDAAQFSIDAATGEVRFLASPNFENPLDADHDNVYDLIVHANDGSLDTSTDIVIFVEDVLDTDPNDFDNAGPAAAAGGPLNLSGNSSANSLNGTDQNDTFSGGNGNDTLYGHGGNDSMNGGANDDVAYGQAGNDTIAGGTGHDTIYGGSGDDVLSDDTVVSATNTGVMYGGSGNDTITGGGSSDTIYGGLGNDVITDSASTNSLNASVLYGDAGDDTITGGGSDDSIYGGAGADSLNGGAGSDIFFYLSIDDSGDTIAGFVHGTDKINLSAIDANSNTVADNAFVFNATQNANTVAHRVTWHQADGNTYIHADVDGDTNADFTITLVGTIGLTSSDFVL